MEAHVNGQITPMSLGELRQAILAVVVGNPHFSPVEQLQFNHAAHEVEDDALLADCLRQVRRADAERGRMAHLLRLNCQPLGHAVCHDPQAQLAELADLLQCRALRPDQKGASLTLIGDELYTADMRLRLLGDAYFALLHNVGYQEVPNRHYLGLLSN